MTKIQKGQVLNPHGRPKGSKNVKNQRWDVFAEWFMSEGMDKLGEEMRKLDGKEYVTTVKDLLEFVKPKLARQEHVGDGGGPIQVSVIKYEDNNPA